MKNLVLVGFMGSGKTTVGKWVADRLGLEFVDMDELIEQRQGKTISEIFASLGESEFRKLERSLVGELAAKQSQVIAAGGGVVLDGGNVREFERTGVVVCLRVTPKIAHLRTKANPNRPLLETANRSGQIKKLLAQREPLYAAIRHQVETSDRGLEAVAQEVIEIYKRDGGGA
jgi:shikimate kinase